MSVFDGRVLDTGYIYIPYIPLHTPATCLMGFRKPITRSPLEEFVEECFREEIDSGGLAPMRNQRKLGINEDFFGVVTIANL